MRNSNRITWGGVPSGDGFPGYDILSPRGAELLELHIHSRRIVGAYLHWIGDRSVPCEIVTGHCHHCRADRSRRWRGYLWAELRGKPGLGIAELSDAAVWPHKDRLEGRHGALAGCLARVRRKDGMPQGKMLLWLSDAVVTRPMDEQELPSLERTLQRIWYGPTSDDVGRRDEDDDDGPEVIPLPGA